MMQIVDITGVTVGGAGVGHLSDGRVVFVSGALDGEKVEIELTSDKKRFAKALTQRVLEPANGRIDPPCRFVTAGCGGCDLQHASAGTQRAMKAQVVVESLQRLGRIDAPKVEHARGLDPFGYRTNLRVGVVDGQPALRKRSSHDLVAIDQCATSHPLVNEMLEGAELGDAEEVTLRAGARTGHKLAVVSPAVGSANFDDDVLVVGKNDLSKGSRAGFHEIVAGERFRVSARSFFQTRADGADVLVEEVGAITDEVEGSMVDLYGGVGLFAGTVGKNRRVELVEQSRSSVNDARANLSDQDVKISCCRVENWTPSKAAVVVADPSREGLGRSGVAKIVATGAQRLALVSCDPGSLGRDAGLLSEAGYSLVHSHLVDLFPQTSHIEVVSRFDRR